MSVVVVFFLKQFGEATAEAIAADEWYQLLSEYSEDEYVMGRKVDKLTVAAVKKLSGV